MIHFNRTLFISCKYHLVSLQMIPVFPSIILLDSWNRFDNWCLYVEIEEMKSICQQKIFADLLKWKINNNIPWIMLSHRNGKQTRLFNNRVNNHHYLYIWYLLSWQVLLYWTPGCKCISLCKYKFPMWVLRNIF